MKLVFLKPGGITDGERPGLLGPFVILGRVRGTGVCLHMVPRQDTFTAAARSLGLLGGGLTSQAQRAFVEKPKDALRDIES